jgi:hypothetical protein
MQPAFKGVISTKYNQMHIVDARKATELVTNFCCIDEEGLHQSLFESAVSFPEQLVSGRFRAQRNRRFVNIRDRWRIGYIRLRSRARDA